MKRDDDYIREMLFEFEEATDWKFVTHRAKNLSEQEEKQNYHIELLCDAGLMYEMSGSVFRMTSQGHDYLDAIRDDANWRKTKAGLAKIGGGMFEIGKELAVAYIKQSAKEKLGITL